MIRNGNTRVRTFTILALVLASGSLFGGLASAGTSGPPTDPNCSHQVGFKSTNMCQGENVTIQHGVAGSSDNLLRFVITGSHSSAYTTLYCNNYSNARTMVFQGLAPQDTYMQTQPCLAGDFPYESFCGANPVCAQR
jgi:hypothetical protein